MRRLRRWFFQDFMTMTVRALLLCEAAVLLWFLWYWTELPHLAGAGIVAAVWFALDRVQPGLTKWLRRRYFPHPAARFAVRAYFGACIAAMLSGFALVVLAAPYLLGSPVVRVLSSDAGVLWTEGFRILSTAVVGTVFALVFYGCSLGQAFIHVPRRVAPLRHLPSALRGLRIVHISDLHLGHHLHGRQLEKYVARVNALEPDLLAITGDIFDHDAAWIDRTLPTLARLRARYGVFVVLGNHDVYTGQEAVAAGLARHTNFTVLRNTWTKLAIGDAAVYLIGLDDPGTHFGQWRIEAFPLAEAIADLPDDGPSILLCHRPDVWPQACAAGIPLTLAGHTHGGQIAMPGSRRLSLASFITRYPSGWFEAEGSLLYVSRGLGVAGSPIRIGAPREIAVHELQPAPHYAPAMAPAPATLQPAEAPVDR